MLRLLVIPPDYFPPPAVLAAAISADQIVLADTYQYVRQSQQNRAAVRTPTGTQWLTIPLEGGQHGNSIDRCRISDASGWRARHLKALRFNYGRAPFFEHFLPEIESVVLPHGSGLAGEAADVLSRVTSASVDLLLRWLGVSARAGRASELEGRPDTLASILRGFPGHSLILAGSRMPQELVGPRESEAIRLEPFVYRQAFEGFEPDLSGLDLLLNYGPAARRLLEQHRFSDPLPA